jgi:hypothetical protein
VSAFIEVEGDGVDDCAGGGDAQEFARDRGGRCGDRPAAGRETIAVGVRGFGALGVWARGLARERAWAREVCRRVSGAVERFLIGRGERVARLDPVDGNVAALGPRAREVRPHRFDAI